MTKLKLRVIQDNKPVKISIYIPAETHRHLIEYAKIVEKETGQSISDPKDLVGPMLMKFMETDRAFLKAKRERQT